MCPSVPSQPSWQRTTETRQRIRSLLAVALLATLGLGALPSHAASEWQEYTHPEYGFSLRVPQGWSFAQPESHLVVMTSLGPLSAGDPPFRMNVNVVIDSVPAGTTIAQFDVVVNETLQQVFPGYQLLRSDHMSLDGLPAVVRYATWHTRDGIALYQLQLGLIVESRFYVVTGTTLAASRRIKDEAFMLQQILVTFRP